MTGFLAKVEHQRIERQAQELAKAARLGQWIAGELLVPNVNNVLRSDALFEKRKCVVVVSSPPSNGLPSVVTGLEARVQSGTTIAREKYQSRGCRIALVDGDPAQVAFGRVDDAFRAADLPNGGVGRKGIVYSQRESMQNAVGQRQPCR